MTLDEKLEIQKKNENKKLKDMLEFGKLFSYAGEITGAFGMAYGLLLGSAPFVGGFSLITYSSVLFRRYLNFSLGDKLKGTGRIKGSLTVDVIYADSRQGFLGECENILFELGYKISSYNTGSFLEVSDEIEHYFTLYNSGMLRFSKPSFDSVEKKESLSKLDSLITKLSPVLSKDSITDLTLNIYIQQGEELEKTMYETKKLSSMVEELKIIDGKDYCKNYDYGFYEGGEGKCNYARCTFNKIKVNPTPNMRDAE